MSSSPFVTGFFRRALVQLEVGLGHAELLGQGSSVPLPGPAGALLPGPEGALRNPHATGDRREREERWEQLRPLLAELPNAVHEGKPRAFSDRGTRQFSSGLLRSTECYQFATLGGIGPPMAKHMDSGGEDDLDVVTADLHRLRLGPLSPSDGASLRHLIPSGGPTP
jgi:hypothetical protein